MTERLLGQETEYGLSVVRNSGTPRESERSSEELLSLAASIPHLPAFRSSGLFLANGSRFYVDCGAHPELATPECANPWDVVRYIRAGEHMLLNLAEQMRRRDPRIARAMILKGNVDYRSRATWGCHESYLHGIKDRVALSRQMIPHLVSRIVFTGAGGFDCFSPGLDFMVSPRVAHLHKAVSNDSTGGRGIFHTKEEPLCGKGHHRLHILCGESLSSDTAAWLKIATTALVVALIEAGKCDGDSVELADPVAAMHVFANDPRCDRVVPLADDRGMTAIEIQEHFLAQAEEHTAATFMPSWAHEVCRQWRAILARLRSGHTAVARTLDWAIKLALFENHARRHDTTLAALAKWSPILGKLNVALAGTDHAEAPLTAELILAPRGPVAAARKVLTPMLSECGLSWDGLAAFLALRLELFEIDTRYGLLGEGGLFTALDASRSALDHRFPGVDNIPHALANPPANGRASIRGNVIRRVAGQNGRFVAEWDGVWDLQAGAELDLTDPFCTSEKWDTSRATRRQTVDLERLFRVGHYAEMLEHNHDPHTSDVNPESAVLAYARIGRRDEAVAFLASLPPHTCTCHHTALMMSILSNGLVPAVREMEPIVSLGERLIVEEPERWNEYSRFVFLSYKALFFMHKGLHQLAEPLFVSLIGDASNAMRSRMCSRNRCYLAELYRRMDRPDEAKALVRTAERAHRAENLEGDLAMHTLPMLAKLTSDDEEARLLLEYAEGIHTMLRNDLGLAHILCIRARRFRQPQHRERIAALRRTVPVLAKCETARRITQEFDSWIAPEPGDSPMDYWGL